MYKKVCPQGRITTTEMEKLVVELSLGLNPKLEKYLPSQPLTMCTWKFLGLFFLISYGKSRAGAICFFVFSSIFELGVREDDTGVS